MAVLIRGSIAQIYGKGNKGSGVRRQYGTLTRAWEGGEGDEGR